MKPKVKSLRYGEWKGTVFGAVSCDCGQFSEQLAVMSVQLGAMLDKQQRKCKVAR